MPSTSNPIIAPYLTSRHKRVLDLALSLALFILTLPLFLSICFLILITTGTPIFFSQKRTGQNHKTFRIYKFRTMIRGAPQQQWRYQNQNQAQSPLFKIPQDPRFVGIGRFLSSTGLDELPQLLNIAAGHMSLIGPRPLTLPQTKKIPSPYQTRHLVRPGLICSWFFTCPPPSTFSAKLKLDLNYISHASLFLDISYLITIITRQIRYLFSTIHPSHRPHS